MLKAYTPLAVTAVAEALTQVRSCGGAPLDPMQLATVLLDYALEHWVDLDGPNAPARMAYCFHSARHAVLDDYDCARGYFPNDVQQAPALLRAILASDATIRNA